MGAAAAVVPVCPPAVRDLAPPGDLTTQLSLPFEFGSVEMQYESYRGSQVRTAQEDPPKWRACPWHSWGAGPGVLPARLTCCCTGPGLVQAGRCWTAPTATHPGHPPSPPPASPPQAQVRYLLRVTVARGLGGSVVKDHPFWVRNWQPAPPAGPPIKASRGGGTGERPWGVRWAKCARRVARAPALPQPCRVHR